MEVTGVTAAETVWPLLSAFAAAAVCLYRWRQTAEATETAAETVWSLLLLLLLSLAVETH